MFPAPVFDRVQRLITEHFPWDGPMPVEWEARLAQVRRWLEQETAIYRAVATALMARIDSILAGLPQQLPSHERGRFLYRLDDRHVLKTPESILEKMARRWEDTQYPPPVSFSNLHELNDLGRFRIVTNFLSDVEWLCQQLEAPYDATKRERLSPAQQTLGREFSLYGNRFKDLIEISHRDRKSGERCRKAHFTPRAPEHGARSVEVQVLTVLQEAWDKKDHFLIYERRRAGLQVDPQHERLSFSLSEQLYLADLVLDQLKRDGASAGARAIALP